MKTTKTILIILIVIVIAIAIAGIIKFNIIGNDVIINEPSSEQLTTTDNLLTKTEEETAKELIAYPISNHPWKWMGTFDQGNPANNTLPSDSSKFVANFGADTSFTSTTDCNSISSSYTTDGININFGEMISTMMFCENSKETSYTEMLKQVTEYNIENDQLFFLLNNGQVMIFQK